MTDQNSSESVRLALRKLLPRGILPRMPKHPDRRNILLGLLSSELERRYPYSEMELNEILAESLALLGGRVDHVTCRRYMVDLGFLKRDRAGIRYFLNYPKLESILKQDVISNASEIMAEVLASQKMTKKPKPQLDA